MDLDGMVEFVAVDGGLVRREVNGQFAQGDRLVE